MRRTFLLRHLRWLAEVIAWTSPGREGTAFPHFAIYDPKTFDRISKTERWYYWFPGERYTNRLTRSTNRAHGRQVYPGLRVVNAPLGSVHHWSSMRPQDGTLGR